MKASWLFRYVFAAFRPGRNAGPVMLRPVPRGAGRFTPLAIRQILWGNPRSLFDLMLQYRTRGFFGLSRDRIAVTYQLNRFNLLNDRTLFVTKKQIDTVTGTPYVMRGFREEPRGGVFTLRVAL